MNEMKNTQRITLKSDLNQQHRELIELRDEATGLLDGFFEQYGSCIVRGCEAIGNRITPGIVALAGMDGNQRIFRVLRFPGAEGVSHFPVYLALHRCLLETDSETVRPIAFRYEIRIHTSHPGLPCLAVDREKESRGFVDAIQDDTHRFITDAQQERWDRIATKAAEKNVMQRLLQQAVPVGTVLTFACEQLPDGWFPCDGRRLNKQEYKELYEAIGDRFGADTTRFRIPDLRAGFIRGLDHSIHAALTYAIRIQSKDTDTTNTNI